MPSAIGGFGCGAAGLADFGIDKKATLELLKRYATKPLTFAVLTQEQRVAIAAFKELGGKCVAQQWNGYNTVGLYVLVGKKYSDKENKKAWGHIVESFATRKPKRKKKGKKNVKRK